MGVVIKNYQTKRSTRLCSSFGPLSFCLHNLHTRRTGASLFLLVCACCPITRTAVLLFWRQDTKGVKEQFHLISCTIMSSVSSMINKFGGAKPGSTIDEQYTKVKAPASPTKNSSPSSPKKSKSSSSSYAKKPVDCHVDASMRDESLNGGDDLLTESPLDKFSKSAPSLERADADKNGRKAPDPTGSVTSKSSRSSKVSTPKTVRKTAIKASDLGIDLSDISSETLNQAVKKWKAEQKAGGKPDPDGATNDRTRGRTTSKERSKSRSKSRGRDANTTPPRSGRSRSKSRSKYQAEQEVSPSKKSGTTPRTVKKKIIIRRRASMETPESEGLARATPKRQESKDDMSDLLNKMAVPSAPDLSADSSVQASEDLKSPKSEPSTTKASPEECVDAVLEQVPLSPRRQAHAMDPEACVEATLEQVPLSPRRLSRRVEMFGPEEVEKQRSSSQGRMAKARADVYEIQKRLKQAGISDEQYKAMLAAGLTVSLA